MVPKIVLFDQNYNLKDFDCGVEELNKYLSNYANQDIKRHLASVFLCLNNEEIIGYYTLSSNYIDISELPAKQKSKLPHYPYLPAVLIGRFAIKKNMQGMKIGEYLLMDALNRVFISEVASYSVIVDAKNINAINFYKNYGFIEFQNNPNKLFLPMKIITKIFQ